MASSLKVAELRKELEQRGLDTSGLKAVLVARLEEAMAADAAKEEEVSVEEVEVVAEADPVAKPADEPAANPIPAAAAMTAEEKRAARAARFGIPVVESKAPKQQQKQQQQGKKKRPQQHQQQQQQKAAKLMSIEDMEKARARAKKFGTPLPPGVLSEEAVAKVMARAARFQMNEEQTQRALAAAAGLTKKPAPKQQQKQGKKGTNKGGKGNKNNNNNNNNNNSRNKGSKRKNQGGQQKQKQKQQKPQPEPISAEEQAKRDARAARFAASS